MDWSSDLSKLFTNYTKQKQYNAGGSADINGDGVTNAKDLNLLKNEEKSLFSKEIKISDLVDLSTKKDIDNDGNVDETENNFFNYVKENVYNILAKNINKDNDLTVKDMVELEETIRNLDEEGQENVGQELRKLQNRMVSNLTSQFFVTKETTAYKDAAAQNVIDVLEAKLDLENLTVKNNPFGDTKALDLFDKLENRSTRTLAEKYTTASIEEFKETLDKTKLVVKTESTDDEGDEQDVPVSQTGFAINSQDGLVYYNGRKYTGSAYPANPGKYYQEGKLLTGQASDGRYYCLGNSANGPITSDWEINSASQTKSRTITTCTAGYKTKEVVETKSNDDNETLILEEITLYGDNHKKKSCEVRTYDSKGNYDSHLVEYESNGTTVKSSADFKYNKSNNKYNGEYTAADGKILIYSEGQLLTGIYNIDKKYYEAGEIKPKATDSEGNVYINGILAQGINKEGDVTNYYNEGKLIVSTDTNSDFANSCKFIDEFGIKDVVFTFENEEYSFSEFSGSQYVDYDWRNVEYKFDFEKDEMEVSVAYAPDISLATTYEIDANQDIIDIKSAKYNLNGTEVGVAVNGSNTGIDYSLQFVDADGVHTKVLISEALSDGVTLVKEYELNGENKYELSRTKVHTNSINNIQKGLPYDAFNIEEGKIAHKIENNELTITDTTIAGIKAESVYNAANGSYKEGKITFDNPAEGAQSPITLTSDDSYRIKDGKLYVAIKKANGSFDVTTYKVDGTVDGDTQNIPDNDGILSSLLDKISLKISDISDIKYNQGNTAISSFKYDGVKYNVTETNDIVTIKSEDETVEKQYKNKIVIYEKYVNGTTTNIYERDNNGNETKQSTITVNDGVKTTSTFELNNKKYTKLTITKESGTGENWKKTEETVKTYDSDGNKIVGIVVKTFDTTASTETVKKTVTYVGSDTEWTQKTTVEGVTTTVEKKDVSGNLTSKIATKVEEGKTTVTTYNIAAPDKISEVKITENGGKKETVKVYNSDGTTVSTTTVSENGVTTVYTGDSTADSAIKSRTTISGTTKVEESSFNNGIPALINHYENNKLSMKEELDTSATLQTGELRKYNVTKYKEDGTTEDKTGVKIIKENRTSTIKWNGATGEEGDEEIIGSSGVTVSEIHKSFAQAQGFTVKDVILENGEEVLVGTYKIGNDEEKTVKYSNITVSGGKFSYTAISEISNNVTLRIAVDKDVQKSANIRFNGSEFGVNVNGAAINGTIDAQIKTFDVEGTTGIVNVADVLSDGIIRNRELYMDNNTVKCRETLILGDINTVYQNINKVSDVTAPSISGDGLSYSVVDNNVNITGTVNFKLNNKEDEGKSYTITSPNSMHIQKGSSPKLNIVIKDEPELDYEFNSNGSYNLYKTLNDKATKYVYGADKNLEKINLNYNSSYKKEIDLKANNIKLVEDTNDYVKLTREKGTDSFGFEGLKYTKTGANAGSVIKGNGSVVFKNSTYELGADETVSFSADYKTCTIVTDNADGTVEKTFNFDGTLQSVKINEVNIFDISSNKGETASLEDEGKSLKVTKTATESPASVGYSYTYSLIKDGTTNIGDIKKQEIQYYEENASTGAAAKSKVFDKAYKVTINSDNSGFFVEKTLTGLRVKENYDVHAILISIKSLNGNTISVPKGATVEYSKNSATNIEDGQSVKIKSTTQPISELTYSLSDGKLSAGKLFGNKNVGENATIDFASNQVSITENDSKLTEIYNNSGTLQKIKFDDVEYDLSKVTYSVANNEITFKSKSSNNAYELKYNLKTGAFMSGKISGINIASSDTVKYNADGTIEVTSGVIVKTYDISGSQTKLTIGDSEIDLTGVTITNSADKITLTHSKYILEYKTDGTLESVKLRSNPQTTLSDVKSVVTDGSYIVVTYDNKLDIYTQNFDEINQSFNFTPESYKTFKTVADAYNKLVGNSKTHITLAGLCRKEVKVEDNSLSFSMGNFENEIPIVINFNNDKEITSYTEATQQKIEIGEGIDVKSITTYRAENAIKGVSYEIEGITFEFPSTCTVAKGGDTDITITFGTGNSAKVITLKYKATTTGTGDNEKTTYTLDAITYKNGTAAERTLDKNKAKYIIYSDGELGQ